MWQFFLSSWRCGFRNRVFYAVFILGVALVGLAHLSASFSPRQPMTVALDVGLSGLRFCLVLFAVTLIQDLVGREIEQRSIVLMLSYPVDRSAYLLGRYTGVLALTGTAAVMLGMLLWLVVMYSGLGYEQQIQIGLGLPYWATVAAVWLDVVVVAAFALWISSLSTVTMLPLVLGALFAIAARALGPVFDYLATGADGQEDIVASYGPVLGAVRWLMPDLSRLDLRAWPMYDVVPDGVALGLTLGMAFAYTFALLGLSVHAFSKREFS